MLNSTGGFRFYSGKNGEDNKKISKIGERNPDAGCEIKCPEHRVLRPAQTLSGPTTHHSGGLIPQPAGERGAADAKPKAQIILDAAKVSAASGENSEPKQGQRSQSARGFCPRSTMRVPQPDIIEHFGNADAVPQPPEQCLSRKAGIVRCCPYIWAHLTCFAHKHSLPPAVRYTSAGKHQHRAGHL